MKQTTLMAILKKFQLGESEAGTLLWEIAQEDTEEHFIAIHDAWQLFIIDTCEIQEGTPGFYEGSVITIAC